jgi:hypothetical protein
MEDAESKSEMAMWTPERSLRHYECELRRMDVRDGCDDGTRCEGLRRE